MTTTLTHEEVYERAKRLVANEVKTVIPFSWVTTLIEYGEVSEDILYSGDDEDNYSYCEIYETWIVSDWLADKLRVKGEYVTSQSDWIQIWGRSTTGQAIALDSVIQEIVIELEQACL